MASLQGRTEMWDSRRSNFSACVRRKELKQTWWKKEAGIAWEGKRKRCQNGGGW